MNAIIADERGTYECTEHGSVPVVLTFGRWTGRAMVECTTCGAYIVSDEAS